MHEVVIARHIHVLVVILFLLLFLFKVILLLMNKHKNLNKVKRYTKALDAVFGTLILVSGVYLLYLYQSMPAWLVIKLLLVLIAIPLGIIGLNKHSKLLSLLALLLLLGVYGLAELKTLPL